MGSRLPVGWRLKPHCENRYLICLLVNHSSGFIESGPPVPSVQSLEKNAKLAELAIVILLRLI